MEPRFGADFSSVRVHTGSEAVQMNRELGAQAFAHGSDVYFGAEKSPGNNELTAHELTHVVQQTGVVQCKQTTSSSQTHYQEETEHRISPLLDSQPSLTVQRQLYQPIEGQAPNEALHIQQFITYVEAEEEQYPQSNRNTKLMITRLRKIFYGSDLWEKYLIPGTENIKPHYPVKKEQEPGTQPYRLDPNSKIPFDEFTVKKYQYTPQDSSGQTPAIAKNQSIKLADGNYLDIGHLFAGLDAMNYINTVDAFPGVPVMNSNVEAVTWVGDLGSVLGEIWFHHLYDKRVPSESTKQNIINKYASVEDMLGNIDAYVLGNQFDIAASRGKKVSEILREYYLGEGTEAAEARKNRYSNFAARIGLNLQAINPVSFSNEAAWVKKYATEVSKAAALYVLQNTEGNTISRTNVASIVARDKKGAEELVRLFIKTLKERISAEPGWKGFSL